MDWSCREEEGKNAASLIMICHKATQPQSTRPSTLEFFLRSLDHLLIALGPIRSAWDAWMADQWLTERWRQFLVQCLGPQGSSFIIVYWYWIRMKLSETLSWYCRFFWILLPSMFLLQEMSLKGCIRRRPWTRTELALAKRVVDSHTLPLTLLYLTHSYRPVRIFSHSLSAILRHLQTNTLWLAHHIMLTALSSTTHA